MDKMQYQPMSTETTEEVSGSELQKVEEQKQIVNLNIDSNRPKYGKMLVLFNKGSILITLGPDYVCFIVAFIFFTGLGYLLCVTVSGIIENQSVVWLTYIMTICQCSSYILVAFSNPSVALKDNNPIKQITQDNRYRVCSRCGAESKRKTYHCRQCDVCIQGYDHHCPWTSKCIGKGNLYYFYAFVTITPFYILSFMALMMACLIINAKNISMKHHLNVGS